MKGDLQKILTLEFLEEQVLVLGKNAEQIGAEVGASGRYVRDRIDAVGLPRPGRGRGKKRHQHIATGEHLAKFVAAAQAHRFTPGHVPPFKGKTKESDARLAEISRAFTGRRFPERSGPAHPNWKGGATEEAQRLRNSADMKAWRDAVFQRDDFTCQDCGVRGGRLEAHHIEPFSVAPSLRFEVSNGVTLCEMCHNVRPHPHRPVLFTPEVRKRMSDSAKARYERERAARQVKAT